MPFISIQSFAKRVVAAIVEFTSRYVTNITQNYLGDQTGMPIISGDGLWMVTGSGPSPVQQFYPRVMVWHRPGGAETAWEVYDEILPTGANAGELINMAFGRENLAMSNDGSRIVVGGDEIYVFRRDGAAYVQEQVLPRFPLDPFDYANPITFSTFNTTTGVDASTDIITVDSAPHFFEPYDEVIYRRNGGVADIGIAETITNITSVLMVGRLEVTSNGNSNVNDGANVITTGVNTNRIWTGDAVRYSQGSAAGTIVGLTNNAVYYARPIASTTMTLHPTYLDAINNTNIIDVGPTGIISQVHYFYNASKIRLHPTQLDVQNGTNTYQLTSTGGETHTLGYPYTQDASNAPGEQTIAIDHAGSRIITNSFPSSLYAPPYIAVFDRTGTTWAQSDYVIPQNVVAPSDPRSVDSISTNQGLAISGDGSTIIGNLTSTTLGAGASGVVVTGTITLTFTGQDPLYANAPSLTLANTTWPVWAQPGMAIEIWPCYRQFTTNIGDVWDTGNTIYLATSTIPIGTAVVYDKHLHPEVDIGLVEGTTYYLRQYLSGSSYTVHPTEADALNNTNIINLTPHRYPAAGEHRFLLASSAPARNQGLFVIASRENDNTITLEGPVTWNDGTVVSTAITYNMDVVFIARYAEVFRQQTGGWTSVQRLYGNDPAGFWGGFFNLSCSQDGNIIVIGDPEGDYDGYGNVQIFENTGNGWEYVQRIVPNHMEDPQFSWFGCALAVSADGQHIAISAMNYGPNLANPANEYYYQNLEFPDGPPWAIPPHRTTAEVNLETTGKLYYYKRAAPTSGAWAMESSYFPNDWYYDYAYLGQFIDITDDGNTIVTTGPYGGYRSPEVVSNSLFGRVVTWENVTYTLPTSTSHHHVGYIVPEPSLTGVVPEFGRLCKISADGSRIVIADETEMKVTIYVGSNNGQQWDVEGSISLPVSSISDIDIDDIGEKIVVSSATTTPAGSRVDTLKRTGSVWALLSPLVNSTEPLINFHRGVCISGDGQCLFAAGYESTTEPTAATFNTTSGVNISTERITTSSPHNLVTQTRYRYIKNGTATIASISNNAVYYVWVYSPTEFSLHTGYPTTSTTSRVNLTAATGNETHYMRELYLEEFVFPYTWDQNTSTWNLETTFAVARNSSTYAFGATLDTTYTGNLVYASYASADLGAYNSDNPGTTGTRLAGMVSYRRFDPPATVTPEWVQVLSGGSGYTLGNILTLDGGTPVGSPASPATIQVTGVDGGGAITSAVVLAANEYSNLDYPTGSSVTGGTGTLATFTIWWNGLRYRPATITVVDGGTDHSFGNFYYLEGGTPETFRNALLEVDSVDGDGTVLTMSVYRSATYTSIPDPNSIVTIPNTYGRTLTATFTWVLEDSQYDQSVWWKFSHDSTSTANPALDAGYISSANVCVSGDASKIALGVANLNHVQMFENNPFTQNLTMLTNILLSSTPREDVGFSDQRGVAISKDGTVAAVGAWNTTVGGATGAGGIYIYKYIAFKWRQQQYIPTPCPSVDSKFGATLSLNQNGTLLLVGVEGQDKVDVYSLTFGPDPGCGSTAPTEQYAVQQYINPTASEVTNFGYVLGMTPDGTRMVVGGTDVKVYLRQGNEWVFEQDLIPSGLAVKADRQDIGYGEDVAINDAGNIIVVSAHLYAQVPLSGDAEGRVYVFTRTGTAWAVTASFMSPTPSIGERFGWSVELNATGNVLVVGKYTGVVPSSVGFYLYRNISGTWTSVTVPEPVDLAYGSTVTYVENGANQGVIAFAAQTTAPLANQVYIYSHTYGSPDTVSLQSTLSIPISPGSPTTWFGLTINTLSFSNNNPQYLVVSNPDYSLYNGETTGEVYVYRNTSTPSPNYSAAGPWTLVETITPTNLGRLPVFTPNNTTYPSIRFGQAVYASSDANYIAITSYDFSPPDVTDTYNAQIFRGGSAWVYEKGAGNNWTLSPESFVFTQGPNGQFLGGAMAMTNDAQLLALGGSDFPHATLTPITNDIDNVGQVQSFERLPITDTPYYDWALVQQVVNPANEAATTAEQELLAPVTIGTGTKNFLIPPGLGYQPFDGVVAAASATDFMLGAIAQYDPNTGVMSMNSYTTSGSGSYTSWTISYATQYFSEGPLALSKDGTTLAAAVWGGTAAYVAIYTRGGSPEQWIVQSVVDVGLGVVSVARLYITNDGSKIVVWGESGNEIITLARTSSPSSWSIVDSFVSPDTAYATYDPGALSGDGSTLFLYSEGNTPFYAIAVYTWNIGTSSWDLQDDTSLDGSGAQDSYWGDSPPEWAYGMSCSADGNWLAVTGHRYSNRAGLGDSNPMSTAYIYHRTTGGSPAVTWSLHSIVPFMWYSQTPSLTSDESRCKMSSDGSRLIWASAQMHRVFVIARDYDSDRHWNLEAVLTYEENAFSGSQYGLGSYWGVDMSEDGSIIVAGDPYWQPDQFTYNVGRAIVWRKVDGKYRVEDVLYGPNSPSPSKYVGFTVACSVDARMIVISDEFQTTGRNPALVFDRGV